MTGVEIALIAGTALQAASAISQGNAARAAGQANAQVLNANAQASRDAAAENTRRQRRLGRKALGTIRNKGFVSLDVLEDQAKEAELEALTILHRGEVEAVGFQNRASMERFRGKQAQKQGYLSAAATLLKGGAGFAGGSSGGSFGPGSSPGSVNASQGIGLRDSSGFIG